MVEKIFADNIEIARLLIEFIESHKAGSPTEPNVYWIHLKPKEIAKIFEEKHNLKISHGMIKRQLLTMNFKYRKLSKQLPTGKCQDRDIQFKIIFGLVALMSLKNPIISIDCKKKSDRRSGAYRQFIS